MNNDFHIVFGLYRHSAASHRDEWAPRHPAAVCDLGHMVHHVKRLGARNADKKSAADDLSLENVLEKVQVFRSLDHIDFLATIEHLFDVIPPGGSEVKLVVVDSVAVHLRSLFGESGVRSRLLARLARHSALIPRF